jgi:uncharacterized membrane protein YjjP (DUF1212 family)
VIMPTLKTKIEKLLVTVAFFVAVFIVAVMFEGWRDAVSTIVIILVAIGIVSIYLIINDEWNPPNNRKY